MINDLSQGMMSRRTLLLGAAMASAFHALAKDTPQSADAVEPAASSLGKLKICVFSKHLQWTSVSDAAAIAKDIGFDGVDLTVRSDGHIAPDRVETDLPAAVEAVHRAGLEVPMITTEIMGVDTPHADAILRTASKLGIRQYRWGWFSYLPNEGVAERINQLK